MNNLSFYKSRKQSGTNSRLLIFYSRRQFGDVNRLVFVELNSHIPHIRTAESTSTSSTFLVDDFSQHICLPWSDAVSQRLDLDDITELRL